MFLLQAFESSIISARNELAVYNNIQNSCRRKLETFPTTLEEDKAILADATAESSFRLLLAVQVRIEDKQVFAGVIDTIEQWKHVLATCPEKYPPSTTRL
uniref:Rubisco LSMT substrate-binding domain-containing protein n=1 Tax=Peronospora matthiolae TaxID=2874970 RepID=A0AAV1V397_9STRA